MIQSRFTFLFWVKPIAMTVFATGFLLSLILSSDSDEKVTMGILNMLILLLYGPSFFAAMQIRIDTANNRIELVGLFSKRTQSFPFSDYRLLISTYEDRLRGGPVKALYLMREDKGLLRVEGSTYANVKEMEVALRNIPFTTIKTVSLWSQLLRKLKELNG